ncbi:MAG: response regulator [Burkholderiaceae bacterium]|nr:response regulator [Burkholderiaceae bacterium]
MNNEASPASVSQAGSQADAPHQRRILVVNADRATFGLLAEWLIAAGYEIVDAEADADGGSSERAFAAAIIDVPFIRHGVTELARRVSTRYPGTPILALSATFFSNVRCGGECARKLGVTGVLPKPVGREALLEAVGRLAGNTE